MTQVTCSDLARSLSAFVDGELDPGQVLRFQQHIDTCEACAARVSFARASRSSVRSVVKAVKAPDSFRMRATSAIHHASQARDQGDVMVSSSLLSWRVAGPLAVAAAFALVWISVSKLQERAESPAQPTEAHASMIPVDALVDTLVDQHANPLPPEATNPSEFAQFDRFVGVPVRSLPQPSFEGRGQLLGARMVPLHEQRAAMLQYVLQSGQRVSVYVYNPKNIRLGSSPVLRARLMKKDMAPVYVGYVRGYSVAITDRRGVGYAMASDLDENESSELLVAMGNH